MVQPLIAPSPGRAALVTSAVRQIGRRAGWLLGGAVALGAIVVWAMWGNQTEEGAKPDEAKPPLAARPKPAAGVKAATVTLSPEQQQSIGLKTVQVSSGHAFDVLSAPGRVAPNETQYAFITPRAAGVVRTVTAHIGQEVKAGDLLATIDSPIVGEARLSLYTQLQALDIARAQADWQAKVYESTLELLGRLRKGETPETIHDAMADRPVGVNRETLMTAYAKYRLGQATIARNRELFAQKLITPKQFEKVQADFEVAQSAYQSLMDQTGYENRLANTRAQQALKQAETAVRAARERLRILGVKSDGTEPRVESGKVVGVKPDGTLTGPKASDGEGGPVVDPAPEKILPGSEESAAVEPVGAHPNVAPKAKETPVSTYSIWAPFDGVVLDREGIVPGVAVDTTHRIFTMANLSTVWVEANIHESDFDMLARSRGGEVRFRSPAYPDRVFEGRVLYSGDVVEEKSRTVKLLAEAQNPDRLLKPGMFVEVEVVSPRERPAVRVPETALLSQGDRSFVYVRMGPDQFVPREVVADVPHSGSAVVRKGLEPGEEVVIEGGSKIKAMAAQLAKAE
jgi:multidrug efflux pump subunit AcrA (membrane-fusion protein)